MLTGINTQVRTESVGSNGGIWFVEQYVAVLSFFKLPVGLKENFPFLLRQTCAGHSMSLLGEITCKESLFQRESRKYKIML